MTNINLSQSFQTSRSVKKTSTSDKGVYISIAILAVTLLVFGVLKLGTMNYTSKKAVVENQIEDETRSLDGKDVDRIADFQKRASTIDAEFSTQKDPNEMLRKVSQSMVSGSVIKSLNQEGDSAAVSLEVNADNFLTAAKQILGLKKAQGISSVQMTEISRDEEGRVNVVLEIKL